MKFYQTKLNVSIHFLNNWVHGGEAKARWVPDTQLIRLLNARCLTALFCQNAYNLGNIALGNWCGVTPKMWWICYVIIKKIQAPMKCFLLDSEQGLFRARDMFSPVAQMIFLLSILSYTRNRLW